MADADVRPGRAWLAILPLLGFLALAALLYSRLGAGDASQIPSPLVNKPAPSFKLAAVTGLANVPGLSDADLRKGQVTLVNVFASWCLPCHAEHPVLEKIAADKQLAALGLRVVGLAYKDTDDKTRGFLEKEGNPYSAIGADIDGRTGIDFGVYGVPETFIVRGDGVITYKFIGPMTAETLRKTVLPEIARAMR